MKTTLDKVLQHYQTPPQEISNEDFHAWKHDPVTEQFFQQLAEIYLNEITIPQYAREEHPYKVGRLQGIRERTEDIINWNPNEEKEEDE